VKVEARLFLGVTVFLWLVAIGYAWWTDYEDGQIEAAGFAALLLSGGLMAICGSFFWFVSRRIDARPEDRQDAEIAEGAGELGFFSPGSYWPLGIAAAATVAGTGLAFMQWWIVVVGGALILCAVGGLLFEYYIGGRRPLNHH
jgi:hypothetical protein